ncbi:MAG: DUF222 domain-containing protein [Propionicimonas sp.]|uniref:HNH endonuclease signature motif containing protein n=1 Tax=Propionicimonas sp. TaxID=1955623 RepID=UPI003D09FA15
MVGEAAVAGRVGGGQARAIAAVLDGLAPQLDEDQQAAAEQVLLELASHLDADQLAKAGGRVLAQVAPSAADELLEARLQREAEQAHRDRSLRFFSEGGSVRFDGSLPRVEAERWIAQLDACAERLRRTSIERRDPLAELPTFAQRRADALIALLRAGESRSGRATDADAAAPPPAGARVIVNVDYEKLRRDAAAAGVLGDDEPLSAGDLRRLCCDAEIIPVVLGAASEPLDVGRAQRLVTPAIRSALIVRDAGCAFPGCDAPPSRSDAHHIVPWWQGGPTSLANLVLQCHTHHALIEPASGPTRDQWRVRIASDGLPEFLPPRRLDPEQKPVRHARHQRDRTTADPGPPSAA